MTEKLYDYLMQEIPDLIEDFIKREWGNDHLEEWNNHEGIVYNYNKSAIVTALTHLLEDYN